MKTFCVPRLMCRAGLVTVIGAVLWPMLAHAECKGNACFSPYRENYMLYNVMRNNGWSANDDRAIRVHYSIKYTWWGDPAKDVDAELRASEPEVFTSYTGMFDFYAKTRDSSPVINRLSNLGLVHLRIPGKMLHLDGTSWEISGEHRSNGQVFDPTTSDGAATAQQHYSQAQAEDRRFFDTLSRGSNYIGVQALWMNSVGAQPVYFRLKGHVYLNQDTQITWGPLAYSNHTLRNDDLVHLRAHIPSTGYGTFGLLWRMGKSGLMTDSWDFTWQATGKVPLFLKLHRGGMNTLSNYTQRQDSMGVGLMFTEY